MNNVLNLFFLGRICILYCHLLLHRFAKKRRKLFVFLFEQLYEIRAPIFFFHISVCVYPRVSSSWFLSLDTVDLQGQIILCCGVCPVHCWLISSTQWVCLVMPDCLEPHGLCSPPGCSVHGISQANIPGWVAISSFGGIFPTQESNLCLARLLYWQVESLALSNLLVFT